MDNMSLTSSGQAKVLSFEEFTAAQAGGMSLPGTEPNMEQPEIETPEMEPTNDLQAIDGPEEADAQPTDDISMETEPSTTPDQPANAVPEESMYQ